MVKEMFSTITGKYDFLNHFLSLGQDIAWRRFAVQRMRFFRTFRFLDVATGTADLAIETVKAYPRVGVVGLDFVQEMIDKARWKIEKKDGFRRIGLLRGDALHIPFPDGSFDVAGIAFGIRNIPDRKGTLEEMRRVVAPGGQVLVLEFQIPGSPFFRDLYDLYLNRLLPFMARLFSPNPAAYEYLGDSIMTFPSPTAFTRLMADAGLERVRCLPLTRGITHLYIGFKPERKKR
jgi:demethylmenaquinone methyltransferase/2-methoxy-6-polyprenyl-1,4-benzoquinol methylase